MSDFPSLLQTFHASLLDNDAAASIPLVKPNPRITPTKQLAIYIDGYRSRLIHAIRSDYPALLALLGEQAFNKLALAYIETHPPSHFNLDRYPHAFADFSRTALDAFAADLAVLEGAIAETFMQPESKPLEPSTLASLTPEAFSELALKPRTASRMLHLAHPAEDYIMECRDGHTPAPPVPSEHYLYLLRHHNEVKRYQLTQAEYRLLEQFYNGQNVGSALDNVSEQHPELLPEIASHLQSWFARWTEHGFFKCHHSLKRKQALFS